MRNCYLNKLCFLTLLVVKSDVFASDSIADGKAVVTLRNNQPCFSFPLDETTKKIKFLLYKIEVYFNKGQAAYPSTKTWVLKINEENKKFFNNPNTPEQCIEYGVSTPNNNSTVAIPVEINVPYQVFLTIYSPEIASSSASIRSYYSDFCLILGATHNKIVVNPKFNSSTGVFQCEK